MELAGQSGQPQTVDYSGDFALPYEFMVMLKENPLVTLNYTFVYGETEYTIVISGENAVTEPVAEWYGLEFLIEYYAKGNRTGGGVYVVQSGDTLSKIANRFNTTVLAILSKNNIPNPNYIVPGQKIVY